MVADFLGMWDFVHSASVYVLGGSAWLLQVSRSSVVVSIGSWASSARLGRGIFGAWYAISYAVVIRRTVCSSIVGPLSDCAGYSFPCFGGALLFLSSSTCSRGGTPDQPQ